MVDCFESVVGLGPGELVEGENLGGWVSVKHWGRVVATFAKRGELAGSLELSLRQARNVSGVDAKPLEFRCVGQKVGDIERAEFFSFYDRAYYESKGSEGLQWSLEVLADDLDVAEGFCAIQAVLRVQGDPARARGFLCYYLGDCRHPQAPEFVPSAVTD